NLVWLPGVAIGFFDSECPVSVNEELRQHIHACVRAVSARDAGELERRISDLSTQHNDAAAVAFRAWFVKQPPGWFEGGSKSSPDDFISGMLQAARANQVQIDAAPLALLRGLAMVFEVARQIDADIDIGAACRRAVTRWQVRTAMQSFRPEQLLSQADD